MHIIGRLWVYSIASSIYLLIHFWEKCYSKHSRRIRIYSGRDVKIIIGYSDLEEVRDKKLIKCTEKQQFYKLKKYLYYLKIIHIVLAVTKRW
jgi:hypothetical protein